MPLLRASIPKSEVKKVKAAYNNKFKEFENTTRLGVGRNTIRWHRELYTAMSRQSRASYIRKGGPRSQYPGLGISTDVIGVQTGKLRANLKSFTSKNGFEYVGQVGYSKSVYPDRPQGALSNALDYPSRQIPYIYEAKLKKSKYKGEDPNLRKYIGIVLLGSGLIHGRNVFRLVMYRDITSLRTVGNMTNSYRALVGQGSIFF